MTDSNPFASGIQALQATIAAAEKRSAGADAGSFLQYFKWDVGDSKILRFIADDMIVGDFYDFIVDKRGEGKTQNFMVDPRDPDRLSRFRSATPGIGWRKPWNSSTLEDPKTTRRAVCVAVLREEVPGKGIQDYIYEREIDGVKYPSRYFGIVQQGVGNFWHSISTGIFKRYGSIAVVDLEITRTGKGLDTKYTVIPCREDPNLNNTDIVKKFYSYGEEWDPKAEDRFLKCPQTTLDWATYFSSEERHERWLKPDTAASSPDEGSTLGGATPSGWGSDNSDPTSPVAAPTTGTKFASLADELLNKARGK